MNIYAIFQLGTYEGPNELFQLWLALVLAYFVVKFIHKRTGMFPELFGTKKQARQEEINDKKMEIFKRANRKLDKF